jgi:acyl carrier protein
MMPTVSDHLSTVTERMTPDQAEIAARTLAWVRENFLYMRPDWKVGEDDPLVGNGVIDSVGVIELVEFLQREFGCTVEEDEITERNLGSLGAIARFVYAKNSENGGASGRAPHAD